MKIPLIFRTTEHQRCVRGPVSFGVPLPRGAMQEPGAWSLGSSSVGTHILDRWGDGSIRWLLVEAQMPDGDLSHAELTSEPGAASASLSVQETDDAVTVDTGRIRVVMRAGAAYPFAAVEKDGRQLLSASGGGTLIADENNVVPAVTGRVVVERRSALCAVVRTEATVTVAAARRIELITRLDFFAGHSAVRVRMTVRNPDRAAHPGNYWDLGDPGSVLIKACTLALARANAAEVGAASVESGAQKQPISFPFELYQDSSGGEYWNSTNHINRKRVVPASFRGYRVRSGDATASGLRATPIVTLGEGADAISVIVPRFWQNCPRAIEAEPGALRIGFFPSQYADLHELQGGEQKTHECYVAFGPDAAGCDYEWCRTPALAAADPAWVMSTGAVDGLGPLEPGHRELVDQAVEGSDTFEHKREVIDEYGWRHFGDIYGDHEAVGHQGAPLTSHYNNQYDPVLGFALQFLRTADQRWYGAMEELAAHVIDIDIYHTARDKSAYNGGLFWHTYHYGDADTSTHRTYPKRNTGKVFGGGPSADHNYPSGLALRYFITGDESSREAAIGLAEYVINLEDWRQTPFRFLSRADTGRAIYTPPGYHGPSRSSGNSLNALVDGHRLTGDRRFLDKADLLVRRVVHPLEDPGRNRLDEPEFRWFYAMFLQSLGKYLWYKAERGLFDAAYEHGRESLLTYARWMAEHEYPYLEKPEKLEFPTETWAAQDIRKCDIFHYAAMHATGAERQRFQERAAFFHQNSIQTLQGMPTRSLARPMVVLLTSGILHGWAVSHRDFTLPRADVAVDFGKPALFEGQRAIAERRAKRLAAAAVAAAVAGSAALVALWFA